MKKSLSWHVMWEWMKSFGAVKIWDERPEWLILSHPNHDSDRFRSTQSAVILPITQSTTCSVFVWIYPLVI